MERAKNANRFLTPSPAADAAFDGDFDESDVWGFGPESRSEDRWMPIPVRRSGRKKAERADRSGGNTAAVAASLPMNIPDWSKILKEENGGVISVGEGRRRFDGEEGDEEVTGSRSVVPPHEVLWRRREASFSVQEGMGRTLKGRDLSRVRDAIWQRTGFED